MNRILISTVILLTLCPVAFFCSKGKPKGAAVDSTKTVAQSNAPPVLTADSVLISPDSAYAIRIPLAYAVRDVSSDGLEIGINTGKAQTLDVSVMELDDYYFKWAMELDSRDTIKGFAMARALTGPPVGEPDGVGSDEKIDSLFEFRNDYGLRCFRIRCTYTTFELESDYSSSYPYECFFVDISKGKKAKLIQMLHSFEDSILTHVCDKITQRISLPPNTQ